MDHSKNILSSTADAILEKSIRVDIDVLHPRWWERIAMRWGWLPAKRTFSIRPATLGNMIRISRLLLEIDADVYKKNGSALESNYVAYNRYGDVLAQVVATAIANSEQGPGKDLIRFIKENLTAAELMSISGIIIRQLDLVNFMSTIISIRGVSLLNPVETIASGE
ncbi:hypothetical protein F0L74_17480 [Chitinophaga agrisoli]|uniref:Uncharacterized protein n=1 Tax=Chitinophaga agrisoli TaxID=2607653 RepID=A0A5B2VU79_9BACT|nr:hypothetical protein [Chitinophaga agrisoli]KAA2241669.1 hypothetical protein F0L74_17480 [Chitinophaga agrisoli]